MPPYKILLADIYYSTNGSIFKELKPINMKCFIDEISIRYNFKTLSFDMVKNKFVIYTYNDECCNVPCICLKNISNYLLKKYINITTIGVFSSSFFPTEKYDAYKVQNNVLSSIQHYIKYNNRINISDIMSKLSPELQNDDNWIILKFYKFSEILNKMMESKIEDNKKNKIIKQCKNKTHIQPTPRNLSHHIHVNRAVDIKYDEEKKLKQKFERMKKEKLLKFNKNYISIPIELRPSTSYK